MNGPFLIFSASGGKPVLSAAVLAASLEWGIWQLTFVDRHQARTSPPPLTCLLCGWVSSCLFLWSLQSALQRADFLVWSWDCFRLVDLFACRRPSAVCWRTIVGLEAGLSCRLPLYAKRGKPVFLVPLWWERKITPAEKMDCGRVSFSDATG